MAAWCRTTAALCLLAPPGVKSQAQPLLDLFRRDALSTALGAERVERPDLFRRGALVQEGPSQHTGVRLPGVEVFMGPPYAGGQQDCRVHLCQALAPRPHPPVTYPHHTPQAVARSVARSAV